MSNIEDFDMFNTNQTPAVEKYMRAFKKTYPNTGVAPNPYSDKFKEYNFTEKDHETINLFLKKTNKDMKLPTKDDLIPNAEKERKRRMERAEALKKLL